MYQYKDKYTIDFRGVKYYYDMHFTIRDSLEFPDYYGCNWDAFWDCLTDMYGDPIHIEIIGLDVIRRIFDGSADKIIEIFKEFKHNYNDKYADEIIIEIVTENGREFIE